MKISGIDACSQHRPRRVGSIRNMAFWIALNDWLKILGIDSTHSKARRRSSRNVSVSWQFYLLSERRWAKSSVSFVELEREKKKKKSHLKNKNKNISDFPRKLNR